MKGSGRKKRKKRKQDSHKALVLISGGLDSRLAARMMKEQLGAERVEGAFFQLPFGGGCCNDVMCTIRFCQTEGIKLHVIDCTNGRLFEGYMKLIKEPEHGRGTAMNPCIDCHLFMLKEARKLADKTGAELVVTGEVLGERPMSQNRVALTVIDKEAGLGGRLLRPLSAKLMEETGAERDGWIDRSRLKGIHGRRRTEQIAMARGFGIDFPMPGGGCLLTDRAYSRKLENYLENWEYAGMAGIEMVGLGRHFRMNGNGKNSDEKAAGKGAGAVTVIVGRNEKENGRLEALARKLKPSAWVLVPEKAMGPSTIIIGDEGRVAGSGGLELGSRIAARYCDGKGTTCFIATRGKTRKKIQARPLALKSIEKLRV